MAIPVSAFNFAAIDATHRADVASGSAARLVSSPPRAECPSFFFPANFALSVCWDVGLMNSGVDTGHWTLDSREKRLALGPRGDERQSVLSKVLDSEECLLEYATYATYATYVT